MKITLLGSGEAVGVPAPLCDCKYCKESPKRRRPSLLIETEQTTVVLDASPDIKEQLHTAGTADVDAFFLTHHHFDHVGGLHDLAHAAMGFDTHVGIKYLPEDAFSETGKPEDPEFDIYLSETALDHLKDSNPHLLESLDVQTIEYDNPIDIGNLRVVSFPVEHARPDFDTLGYAVYHGDRKVVYSPDMWEFIGDHEYTDADLLFAEGAALFRAFGHGEEEDLRSALATADAERTVLMNLNEHLQRMTTEEIQTTATQDGYEPGEDFAEYHL